MNYRHICFVDSIRTWGGAEVWVVDTARHLSKQGYNCSIVAQPGSELLTRAQNAGVPCTAIPIRFDAAPWTLAQLTWYFRKHKVTAIVANLTKDLKAAAVAGRLAGVKTILASRESDFPLKDKLYYRWYFTKLATGLLVNSRATRATVLKSAPWLDENRVHLLYKGIDTERFKPASKPSPATNSVGFVGQLIERKGLLDLMEAWQIVENQDWAHAPHLFLAGEGPLVEKIKAWQNCLTFPGNVHLLGFHESIADFYREISVLVMPSLAEGFGLAAAEAAACSIPVIATDTSSLPEIVLPEETGLLIPINAPEDLAKAMIRLLNDNQMATTFGIAGRNHVEQNFSLQKTLEQLLQLTRSTHA